MTQAVSDYAPKPRPPMPPPAPDPLLIGKITIAAVDEIGIKAAAEIDRAALQVREGAEEVAAGLEKLAEAIRGHSKIASEHTAAFVARTAQVLETVRALGVKLDGATTNGSGIEEANERPTE